MHQFKPDKAYVCTDLVNGTDVKVINTIFKSFILSYTNFLKILLVYKDKWVLFYCIISIFIYFC